MMELRLVGVCVVAIALRAIVRYSQSFAVAHYHQPLLAAAHYSLLLVSLVRSQCLNLSQVGGCSPPFEAGWQTGKGTTIEGIVTAKRAKKLRITTLKVTLMHILHDFSLSILRRCWPPFAASRYPSPLLAILRCFSLSFAAASHPLPSFVAARYPSPLLTILCRCSPSFATAPHPSPLLPNLRCFSLSFAASRYRSLLTILRRCSLSLAAARYPSLLLAIVRYSQSFAVSHYH